MATSELRIGVQVDLEVGERTAEWLESMGWIRPGAPSSEVVETEAEDDDYDPRPLGVLGDTDLAELIPEARPLRGVAMTGAEAMLHNAARLRRDLMNEVSSPERVDEMLRNLDVNVEALAAVGCDC